jgi:hypothetical protein
MIIPRGDANANHSQPLQGGWGLLKRRLKYTSNLSHQKIASTTITEIVSQLTTT